MIRRTAFVLLTAATAGLAGMVAQPAVASLGTDRPPLDASGRTELYLGHDAIRPNYVMVLNKDATLGLDLRKAVPQVDEDSAQLTRVLMEEYTHPPLRRVFDSSTRVGTVYMFKNSLFVLPDKGDIAQSPASILHRARAFEPRTTLVAVNLTNRPSAAQLKQGAPVVGEAYQTANRLFLVIRPAPADGVF